MNNDFPITKRLYYNNSHLLEFSAEVLNCKPNKDNWSVILDQTAFYPTGGGQPFDTGRLGEAQVVDCVDNDEHIIHIIDKAISGTVLGKIDPLRRRDHLQQHTGQHILSQAFIQVAKAETRGFHLGTNSSTIDLEIDQLSPELIAKAEDLANKIVFENRLINIHLTNEKDKFPLRKDTERENCIRIIEVEGFDFSPCGGTHAHQSGEIGLIVIRSIERIKRLWRVEFLCGQRALLDYRAAHQIAIETAKLFSAARDKSPELVIKLQQELKDLQKHNRELLNQVLKAEATNIYNNSTPNSNNLRIVKATFSRSLDELKTLAQLLVAQPSIVALLATTLESPKIIFACSNNIDIDCGKLLSQFCKEFDGRGGGKAEFAQGGLPIGTEFETALESLVKSLQKSYE
ncbi:MAG: alaS2 [bacterium]|nr:MAG: alaS2 [bacterium]